MTGVATISLGKPGHCRGYSLSHTFPWSSHIVETSSSSCQRICHLEVIATVLHGYGVGNFGGSYL